MPDLLPEYHSESHARSVRYPVWLDGVCFYSLEERLAFLAEKFPVESEEVIEADPPAKAPAKK